MMIHVKGLVKEYLSEDGKVLALDNVNFSITSGQFVAITGRSGSGKSTLMNIMAGLTNPSSGTVTLNDKDIFSMSDIELSLYRNATVGCLPQVSSVLPSLSVLDNVRLPFHLSNRKGNSEKRAHALLEMMGIVTLADRKPKRLSGGQMKRVAIARAMMNKPDFLLVDEPTGDLDTQTTREIMQIFRTVADDGIGVLMITHDLETTEYADKHFIMRSGVLSQS